MNWYYALFGVVILYIIISRLRRMGNL